MYGAHVQELLKVPHARRHNIHSGAFDPLELNLHAKDDPRKALPTSSRPEKLTVVLGVAKDNLTGRLEQFYIADVRGPGA